MDEQYWQVEAYFLNDNILQEILSSYKLTSLFFDM